MRLGEREGRHLRGHEQAYANEIVVKHSKTHEDNKGSMGMHKGSDRDAV